MVISGVVSRVAISISHNRGLIILLIFTHEPLSRAGHFAFLGFHSFRRL